MVKSFVNLIYVAGRMTQLNRVTFASLVVNTMILLTSFASIFLTSPPSLANTSNVNVAIRFDTISTEQGLDSPNVISLVQDSQGFIWVGTDNGLYRFDGYQFKQFIHDPEVPTSLPGNYIQHLYLDSLGELWISIPFSGFAHYHPKTETFTTHNLQRGTQGSLNSNVVNAIVEDGDGILWIATYGGGLNRYDRKSNTFSHFKHDPKDPTSLSDDYLYTLLLDNQDILWLGTRDGGLNRFDKNSGQFKRWKHSPTDFESLSHNRVYRLLQDSEGTLWVGTRGGGLNRYNAKTDNFTRYNHDADAPASLSGIHVYSLFEDKSGTIWVGTAEAGLNRFDRTTRRFIRHQYDPQNAFGLADNDVWAIIEDNHGLIWVGTYGGGINKFDPDDQRFGLVKHTNNRHSLSKGKVQAIYKDKAGIIWIGTESGLNRHDEKTGQFKHYQHQPNNPKSLSHNNIWVILEDSTGTLWVGTRNDGLNRFNPQNQTFTRYHYQPNNVHSLNGNDISDIVEDNTGNLWISTANGINRFNRQLNHFVRHTFSPQAAPHSTNNPLYNVTSLLIANDGSLWAGTYGGLYHFDQPNNSFAHYRHNIEDPNSLSHNLVMSVYQDKHGLFWIGTDGGGLNKFNSYTNTFTHYRKKDGLANDSVATVLGDDKGNLWLGLRSGGISFVQMPMAHITNNIGAQANCSADLGASFKASDGKLFFGSDGYCAFYPEHAIKPSQPPAIVFTDFRLLNKSVFITTEHTQGVLSQAINLTESVTLSHKDNVFSFEFAALHYTKPRQNQYKYKLEGFNQDWIETTWDNRRATFTNLPSGDYTFVVNASNHEGLWNEKGRAIKLTIISAPWRTWWAYTLYALIIGAIFGAFTHQRRLRIKALMLAKNNAELAKTNAEKANQAKSIFIANVSHEIRTPLNAVLGYTQMLARDPSLGLIQKQKVEIIDKSGNHLLGIIDDILDISKIEANAMVLLNVDFDLIGLVNNLNAIFTDRCEEKHLSWQLDNQCEDFIAVYGDQSKLRQVLINLLGNAVKFTEQGSITFKVSCDKPHHYRFEVIDSGPGITSEYRSEIFNAFGQTLEGSKQGGTGLGLAIAHRQVALMGGELTLASEPGQSCRFYFTLPLPPAQAAIKSRKNKPNHASKLASGVTVSALVAEDTEKSRDILSQMLQYIGVEVTQACNGQEALNQLHQAHKLPDLVFMDIRMPIMDGLTALKKIHHDFKEQSPRCIVITTHAMQLDIEYYLNQGFDYYLGEPFRFDALDECLHRLLDVEFDQQSNQDKESGAIGANLDYSKINIPETLYHALHQAAEDYEVSKLEICLNELGQLNEHSRQFAAQLSQYISHYDMDGLLNDLEKVDCET